MLFISSFPRLLAGKLTTINLIRSKFLGSINLERSRSPLQSESCTVLWRKPLYAPNPLSRALAIVYSYVTFVQSRIISLGVGGHFMDHLNKSTSNRVSSPIDTRQ